MKLTRTTIAAAIAAGALALAGAYALPAEAHTPQVTPSCKGLSLTATAYGSKGGDAKITIDGDTQTWKFGDAGSKFVDWDQTTDHTWAVDFTAYDGNEGGSRNYGPKTQQACDKPQPPKITNETDHRSNDEKTCDSRTVTTTKEERTREVRTYSDGHTEYGDWSEWKVVDRTTRDATEEECPTPPKPVTDRETRTLTGEPDCTTRTVTVTEQERTRTGKKYADGHTEWDDWSDWTTTNTTTKPATEEQCPTPTTTPTSTPTPSETQPTSSPTPTGTPSTTPTSTPAPSTTPSETPSGTPSQPTEPSDTPTPTSTPTSRPSSEPPSTQTSPPDQPGSTPTSHGVTSGPHKPAKPHGIGTPTSSERPSETPPAADTLASTGGPSAGLAVLGLICVAGAIAAGAIARRKGSHQ